MPSKIFFGLLVCLFCRAQARADGGWPVFGSFDPAAGGNTAVPVPVWPIEPEPRSSLSQAVGSYSSGSLLNAAALPPEGTGFVKIERARNRRYGTEETVRALELIGFKYSVAFPDAARLQIGDLSVEGGGKISLHASHQNGLDADAAMIARDEQEQDPLREGFDENFVADGAVSASFDPGRNWSIVAAAAENTAVARIFLDPAVKKLFCELFGADDNNKAVLHVLRPAAHHGDHFHLRFACPPDDTACVNQEPPPDGDGCGASALKLLEQP
ncbi:MAG: penicillin-insensitive murein endopeptidase [Elusimicrobiales bacterium]